MSNAPLPTAILPIVDADWLANLPSATRQTLQPDAVARLLHELAIPMVQLRAKGDAESARPFLETWLKALRHQAPDTRIILNDRLAWVAPLQADGVHVGQGDTPAATCRRELGRHRIIGLSTHTLAEIRQAEALGVDYIGFGPIFPTTTKRDTHAVQGVDTLTRMVEATALPLVAIGGITLENLAEVAATGAQGAALISALWQTDWERRLRIAVETWRR
ncbi:MAG: thiamine phosphate synthase [Magnetococcales bacterium]|nr:thiamine phosphate synthase [Magnetococcales bacterium]